MPYRISSKPKQRPPWDACRCEWTNSIYIQLNSGGTFDLDALIQAKDNPPKKWICCWCSQYKSIHCSIDAKHKFCPECGHARDLRLGEQEDNWGKMFPRSTQSSGPR